MNAEPSGSNGPLSGPLHVFLVAGASIMVLELPSGRLESRSDSRLATVSSRCRRPPRLAQYPPSGVAGCFLAFSAPPPIP